MYHEDGSVLSPRKWPWQKDTLAFGWLDPRRPFREGPCPSEVRRGLEEAARSPIDRTRGFHTCAFCPRPAPEEVGPWSRDFHPTEYAAQRGDTLHLGSASIEVMAGGRRWVAPNLVLHYVSEHGYLPPAEVVAALGEPGRRP